MVSLLTLSRFFVVSFIAFIGVFCVVFWEEHRHEWILYVLMLLASISAVWFFRYIGEIEDPEARSRYLWNVRRVHYALFVAFFMLLLLVIFVTVSLFRQADISFEEAIDALELSTAIASFVLCLLTVLALLLALRMSLLHMNVIEQHDCITAQQRASSGHLQLGDGIWMAPSSVAPFSAEEITAISVSLLEKRDSK